MLAAGGGTDLFDDTGDGVGVGIGAPTPPFGVGAAGGTTGGSISSGMLVTVSAVSHPLSDGRSLSFSLPGSEYAGLDGIFPRIGPGPT